MKKVANYICFKKRHNKESRLYKIEQIANYNLMNNYDYELYVDTVKSSTDIDSRTEFKRLKEDIKRNNVNRVIISSFSNLSRNPHEISKFMKLLKKHNCELESIKEGIINVDEFDQLILAIDQKLKEEKVRWTMRKK